MECVSEYASIHRESCFFLDLELASDADSKYIIESNKELESIRLELIYYL